MDDATLAQYQKQAEKAFPGCKVVYTAADDKWQGKPTMFVQLTGGGAVGGPVDDGGAQLKQLVDRFAAFVPK